MVSCTEYEPVLQDCFTNLCFIISDNTANNRRNDRMILVQTRSLSKAKPRSPKELVYTDLFKNIQELKIAKHSAVYPKSTLKNYTFIMKGLYFSKQRIIESEVASHELGIGNLLHFTDRFSPVGISILQQVQRKSAEHLGVDRTWSKVLSSV